MQGKSLPVNINKTMNTNTMSYRVLVPKIETALNF